MEEKKVTPRQVAVKITIKEVLEGTFIQEDNQSSPELILPSMQRVFRLNIMGILLQKERVGNITTLWIDDGSGKMPVRFFEEDPAISALAPGEALLIISKPRKYNQEIYLSPEIVKKVSISWLKVRVAELDRKPGGLLKREEFSMKGGFSKVPPAAPLEIINEKISEEILPNLKIAQLIKSLDSGGGARIEEVLEKSPLGQTEIVLEKMLENGEIFQVLPGRVKVL